ncbi:MAG: hypothetical protein ACYC0V_03360 [Armatimonadota bacterium]
MKISCWRITSAIIGLIALFVITSANADLLTDQDKKTEIQLGIYTSDSSGNQDFVRQYDGRKFNLWGVDGLSIYGYDRENQYWLEANDLLNGNESLSFNLNGRNTYGLSLSSNAMTHRQGKTPAINPYLAPFGMSHIANGTPTGDAFLDLSPTDTYRLNRRENDFKLNITPENLGWLRLTIGSWQELENGTQQLLFRSRAATPGVIARSTKASAAVPIDRTTTENKLGADLAIGKNSVVNYEYVDSTFTDNGGRPSGVLSQVFPLNSMTRINSKTNTNILKANSRLSKQLYFTGVHINRRRANTTATIPFDEDFVNEGAFLGHSVDTETTNLAMTFLASDALSLTGRWKEFRQEDRLPQIFEVGETSPSNLPLGRDITSWELKGSYTGIRKAYLNAGYERRDEKLIAHEDLILAFSANRTVNDNWNAGFRLHPSERLSISGNWVNKSSRDNRALFPGVPTDQTKLNFNATYLVRDNLTIYGDFYDSDEKNQEIRVAFNDPALDQILIKPTDQNVINDIIDKRIQGAGQGYKNKMTTWGAGAWLGLTPKLSANIYAGRVKTSAVALLVLEVNPASYPLMAADFAPFSAKSDQWTAGLDYEVTSKLRTHGRYQNTVSKGQTILSIIPDDPALSQGWQPVNLRENTWTLGADYRVSKTEKVILDFSVSDWKDKIDSNNNGKFNLWNLSWSIQY